jgi:hypothetical protein
MQQHVGPATQTLAAVRAMARNGETFASVRVIAERACLPARTVERHLTSLVRRDWLERRPRQKRRTPTYIVPDDLLNRSDALKFAILPRWAAWLLDTWAERAVFACIVSRDSLFEILGDVDCMKYGRANYSIKTLAQETGLSRQAISVAKLSLLQRGLIIIDRAMWYQDDRGRCKSFADTLLLNQDYEVPENLIDHRRPKVADCVINRSLEVADTQSKSGGPVCLKVADTAPKSGGCSYGQFLNQPSKSKPTTTAAFAAVSSSAEKEGNLEEEEEHVPAPTETIPDPRSRGFLAGYQCALKAKAQSA